MVKDRVEKKSVNELMETSFEQIAPVTITGRALPDVRDGLKPVHRRIIYTMNKSGNHYNKAYRKSAKVVGNTMGDLHPHGDSGIYGAVITLSQDWVYNLPLLEVHGNNGSIDGDSPADMRYCVVGSTLTDTENGLIPIHKIVKNSKDNTTHDIDMTFIGNNGKHVKGSKFFNCGYHPVVEVELVNGQKIKATLNHPFMTSKDEWKLTEDLVITDELRVQFGTTYSNIFAKSTEDLNQARTLGIMINAMENDGHISKKILNKSLEEQAEFLKFVIDSTGEYLSKDNKDLAIKFRNYLPTVLQDILILLQRFNINATLIGNIIIVNEEDLEKLDNFSKNTGIKYANMPIKKIKRLGKEKVYSVRIDTTDHLYITNNFVSHNTEVRLEEVTSNHFSNNLTKKDVVKWVNNYDDTVQEPTVLPVEFPNLLINGSSGIAMAYSTDLLPHNVSEVMKALIMLAQDEGASYDDLIEVMPAPDFPTGGVIINGSELKDIMYKGKGSIKVRSNYKIVKNKKVTKVVFTDVPYGTDKGKLLKQIEDKISPLDAKGNKNKDRVQGVVEVIDETDKDGVKITATLTKDADAKQVVSNLFAKTGLLKNVSLHNTVIINGKPYENVNFIVMLQEFHKFRLHVTRKEFESNLESDKRELEIAEGFVKFGEDLEKLIELIRQSADKKEAKEKLISEEGFTDLQAESILERKLHQLTNMDFKKQEEKIVLLTDRIRKINILLTKKGALNKLVIKRYVAFEKEYATERKTKILPKDENWKFVKVEEVLDEDVYVSVTYRGNIKRSSVRSYSGTKGDFKLTDKEDKIIFADKVNGQDNIILITNKMRYLYIPVVEFEDVPWKETGKNLALLGGQLESDEFIKSVIVDDGKTKDNILLVVDNGGVKINSIEDMRKKQQYFKVNKYTSLKKEKTERLFGAYVVDETPKGYLGFSDKKGRSMFFDINEIEVKGRGTGYVKGFGIPKGTDTIKNALYSKDKLEVEYEFIHERERGKVGKKTGKPDEELEKRYQEMLDTKKQEEEVTETVDSEQE